MLGVRHRGCLVAAAAAALSLAAAGCSSSAGSQGSGATLPDTAGSPGSPSAGVGTAASGRGEDPSHAEAPTVGRAHLTYTGGATGEFTIESVSCLVAGGKLTSLTAPDVDDRKTPTPPAFVANLTDDGAMASLATPDGRGFVNIGASGITGKQVNGTWTATVSGLTLGPTGQVGDSVVIDGTVTCGRVVGS